MTQTDKTSLFNQAENKANTTSAPKEELDFSFFDEPAESSGKSTASATNDFSFFDEPVETPPHNPDTPADDFSFLDGSAQAGQTEAPQETATSSFNFDDDLPAPAANTQPDAPQNERDTASSQTTHHTMQFSCLKCSAANDVPLPEPYTQEVNIQCCSCSSKIRIIIESNTKRATQKSREIYCRSCGHALERHAHCPSCGMYCPDYFIVENPAEALIKARTARSNNFKQKLSNLRSSLAWTPRSRTTASKPSQFSTISSKPGYSLALGSKQIKLVAGAAVVVLCLCIAAFYYLKLQAEQRYAENYIKATYAIYIGSDAIMNALTKTSKEWKTAQTAGSTYIPKTDTDMEIRVARINSELTKLMQQIQVKVPGKFEQANSKLLDFQGELNQLQKATVKAPTSYDQLSALIDGSNNKLKQKREALKASLNEELKTELDIAKKKFRGFEGF